MKSENSDPVSKRPFFDRHFVLSALATLAVSVLLVFIIKISDAIHIPYFVAVLGAIAIGFLEPEKGWALAILQVILSITGYFLFAPAAESSARRELELFGLYGSAGLTFVASYIGGFLKRALR